MEIKLNALSPSQPSTDSAVLLNPFRTYMHFKGDMDWIVSPQIDMWTSWPPTPQHVIIFADRVFKIVIWLKCGCWSGPESNLTSIFKRRGILDTRRDSEDTHTCRKDRVRRQWEVTTCKPRTEAAPETKPGDHLIWGLQPPELWQN